MPASEVCFTMCSIVREWGDTRTVCRSQPSFRGLQVPSTSLCEPRSQWAATHQWQSWLAHEPQTKQVDPSKYVFLILKIVCACLLVLALTSKPFANVIWNTNRHVRYNCVGLNSALIHVSVGVFYDSSLKSEDK